MVNEFMFILIVNFIISLYLLFFYRFVYSSPDFLPGYDPLFPLYIGSFFSLLFSFSIFILKSHKDNITKSTFTLFIYSSLYAIGVFFITLYFIIRGKGT